MAVRRSFRQASAVLAGARVGDAPRTLVEIVKRREDRQRGWVFLSVVGHDVGSVGRQRSGWIQLRLFIRRTNAYVYGFIVFL